MAISEAHEHLFVFSPLLSNLSTFVLLWPVFPIFPLPSTNHLHALLTSSRIAAYLISF